MLFFVNDYCEGAHPAILQKLLETNMEKLSGYFLAAKKWQKGLYNNLSLKEEKLLLEAILLCSEL